MARLSLSNIPTDLLKRLDFENDYQDMTNNEIVSEALTLYFKQIDADRLVEEPPEPIEIDLDSPHNKKLLDKLRAEKEEKEIELEISESNIKEVKKDFDYKWELKEFARKLNIGTGIGDILKIYSLPLAEIMVKNYGFEIIKVEVIRDIPVKKARYLRKKID